MDRTVHATTDDGIEVVRYDRAGKWYAEHADGFRALLTLGKAVEYATEPGATVHLGRAGGKTFDAWVRRVAHA